MTLPDPPDPDHIPVDPSDRPERPAINKPPITHDFSEDEIEAIERDDTPPVRKKISAAPPEIPADALGAPGRLGWRFPLIAGAIAMLAAVVLAAVYHPADTPWWLAALRQIVDAPLYAWIGVGALLVTARITERPFGAIHFAAARMAFAVGVFALLWQLAAAIVSTQSLSPMLRWPIAASSGAAFYAGWCLYSYRLDRHALGILASLHLIAWVVLWVFRQVGS